MATHLLKTWSPFFEDTRDGRKAWEFREDDRGYCVGDFLVLRQFTPSGLKYHDVGGRGPGHPAGTWGNQFVVRRVTRITRGSECGILPFGYAMMAIAEVSSDEFIRVMGMEVTRNPDLWNGVKLPLVP